MNPRLRNLAVRAIVSAVLLAASPSAARGQHISLKTVPIPTGEQFLIFPSRNLGMGAVSVALDDPLLDPFVNPARGARVLGIQVMGTPTFYHSTQQGIGGRTLPLAVVARSGSFFAGGAVALQQVHEEPNFFVPLPAGSAFGDASAGNTYVLALAGRALADGRTAVGASVFRADLGALDAVGRQLYARSVGIRQAGSMSEYRLGLTRELGRGRSLDAIALYSLLDMTHDVTYAEWAPGPVPGEPQIWTETNRDRTGTLGLHLRYTQPLAAPGWRVGGILTANRKWHPFIPNYDIVNIPRDPGDSYAFNAGLGFSLVEDSSIFAVEMVWEPAWSSTWAYTDAELTTPDGSVIPAGGRTVDNHFAFSNVILGAGIQIDREKTAWQFGLRVRSIGYTLEQSDYVTDEFHRTRERWIEWAPSWSFLLKLLSFDVRYAGRATMKGFPPLLNWGAQTVAEPGGPDLLAAVTDPVFLPDFRVTAHQFSVSIPVGRTPRPATAADETRR